MNAVPQLGIFNLFLTDDRGTLMHHGVVLDIDASDGGLVDLLPVVPVVRIVTVELPVVFVPVPAVLTVDDENGDILAVVDTPPARRSEQPSPNVGINIGGFRIGT